MSALQETKMLLLLALLLYDIASSGSRANYDYDDVDGSKRQSYDDHRNWRKKALQKPFESERKEWDDASGYGSYPRPRPADGAGGRLAGLSGPRGGGSYVYNSGRYDDVTKIKSPSNIRSSELDHSQLYLEKDGPKKPSVIMNCQRQYERFEACFAGCAAVTCDNPRERPRPCYPFCEPGCVCAQPRVRDDRTHKCVLPEDCSK